MKTAFAVAVTLAISAGLLLTRPGESEASPGGIVVLELFTSQGCSSCPPADRLLTEIGSRPEWKGRVLPLAFHVDYWNYIGWTDPFSSKEWSRRQQRYAGRSAGGQVYTPQALVNGTRPIVGSNRSAMEDAIKRSLSESSLVSISASAKKGGGDRMLLSVHAAAPKNVNSKNIVLLAAIHESGLSTTVPRGENSGRKLRNDYVVRSLVRLGRVEKGREVTLESDIPLLKTWNPKNLGITVFAQDEETLKIYGAAVANRL